MSKRMKRHVFIYICLLAFAAACSGSVPYLDQGIQLGGSALDVATKYPNFTDADEERMAQENARKFEAKNPMWDDPLLEQYLTSIGQRIVVVAKQRPFVYRFRIVKDPTVNAFTFGGGLVYFNAGLIARMENEAQLAMVMAHEIAHVTERHIPNGIEDEFGLQILGQLAATAASTTGTLQGPALEITYKYTMNAAIHGHGRSQESEADEVGMEYLVRSGYDPREAPRTFEQLLKEYGDQAPLVNFFYGSHPTNVGRIERTREIYESQYADVIANKRLLVNTEEFKRRTRELVIAVGVLDYKSKRFNTAKAMFNKAARVWDGDPVPFYYLGKITLETGRSSNVADRAIGHFAKAVKADANYAPAYREMGLAYYRKGDKTNAIKAFERYLALRPEAKDAQRIGLMITELKRY